MRNITVFHPSTIKQINFFLSKNKFFPLTDKEGVGVYFPKRFVLMAPFALAMLAAWSEECFKKACHLHCYIDHVENPNVLKYAWRMNLMEFMRINYNPGYQRHEPSGRFIPITKLTTSTELKEFLIDMIPMLHLSADHSNAIKYCFSELIRNVFEHAGSSIPAYACAQYYKKSRKISIGIADCGKGILSSLRRTQGNLNNDDAIAIAEALKPGVSGGLSKENAGAGLYFIRSIAKAAGTQFAIYSGSACYKLSQRRKSETTVFYGDPMQDRHNLYRQLPYWQGTVIAVEIGLETTEAFDDVLEQIRKTFYENKVRQKRKRAIRFI